MMPAKPQQREDTSTGGPPTMIMQGYEKMGHEGRKRLRWIGMTMLTAAGGVGLFGGALSFYRFVIVLAFLVVGTGFIFPQYGLLVFEKLPDFIAKLTPTKLLSRPDRRTDEEE